MAKTFDFRALPDADRLAYHGALFAMAAIDDVVDREEIGLIFDSLDQEGLSAESRSVLRSYLVAPPDLHQCLKTLSHGSPELRYGVMIALTDVALVDGLSAPAEQAALQTAQMHLRITNDQRNAIDTFCRKAAEVRDRGLDDNVAAETLKKAAAGLSAVGVPVAAVYFSGTVIGLSAAGITSGLAALGLGLGMATGVGVVILIGVGVFYGLSWTLGLKKRRTKAITAAERERRAQLVIKGLQEAINDLVDRVASLQADADKARTNEEAIRALSQRLHALQQLLAKRQVALA